MDEVDLACIRILKRTDGLSWKSALEPTFRDTAYFEPEELVNLERLNRMVTLLINEVAQHPLPEFVVYHAPDDPPLQFNPTLFAAALVASRAERLVQASALTAGALEALERGNLQVSAVATRSLYEIAILCADIHQELLDPWRAVHGKIAMVRSAASSKDFKTFKILWETRFSTRFDPPADADGVWPTAKGIGNKLKRLNKEISDAQRVYDLLCDVTHPNLQANASMWRHPTSEIGALRATPFSPESSNSIVKRYIIGAVAMSLQTIINFARDLWWIAADITNTCHMAANERTKSLGLPARNTRSETCSCGSGVLTRLCKHPEPTGITDAEIGLSSGLAGQSS